MMQSKTGDRRHFTLAGLKSRCSSLRKSLVRHEVATDTECAEFWPGGSENTLRGFDGWVECYAQLTRFAGRQERETQEPSYDGLAAAVSAAAAATPVGVTCADGITRDVHPKSYVALEFLEGLANVVEATRAAAARALTAVGEATTEGLPLLLLLPITRSRAVCTWAWVLTTEGAGLPWREGSADEEPPAWTDTMTPEDLLLLHAAHQAVNRDRLAIMAMAFPAEPGERSRLGLGGMLASYAHEHGRPPRDVMRLLSVGEAVASAIAAYESHEVAQRNADARAKERA